MKDAGFMNTNPLNIQPCFIGLFFTTLLLGKFLIIIFFSRNDFFWRGRGELGLIHKLDVVKVYNKNLTVIVMI